MKKTLGLAILALVAAFSIAPAANAQVIQVHGGGHHGGGGVFIGGGHGGWGHGGYGGYGHGYGGGWNGGGWNRGPGIDIIIGRPAYPRPYYPAPVYRQPSVISVYVDDYETIYDRDGYPCGERSVSRYVNAYWDNVRGGYWYTDLHGNYRRAR